LIKWFNDHWPVVAPFIARITLLDHDPRGPSFQEVRPLNHPV
jgi:hypothetical protein